jgi:NAD(P)-dependent dehydrogenase (short-subunit alcohol dehydrogenase family)
MDNYKGKTVLITGGTTGMGLSTAKLFVGEGARVIVTGRTTATIEAAQAELGENAIVIHSDAASLSDMDSLAEKVRETFGKLDLLFVNAGLSRRVSFEETTEEIYDEMLDLNAKGPYFIVQKLAPLMPEGSSVVFTTSIANVKGMPNNSAYAVAKAALRQITRNLATELSPRGIRVNAVSPGPIETPILQKMGMPKEGAVQVYDKMKEIVPMKRIGQPEEIAKAVAFLAFDATYTTGAELPVDGGWSQL